MINFSLQRAQKELCVGYKPLMEALNFFFSETFTFLVDSIPDVKPDLIRLKTLLSQTLAIMISASLKISSARKDALRPLLRFSSTGILSHQPTAEHVLGSPDLANLSEQAAKEHRALSGVFRHAAENRGRLRSGIRGLNRNQNFRLSTPRSGYQSYPRYQRYQYQEENSYPQRRPRSRPKNRRTRTPSNK